VVAGGTEAPVAPYALTCQLPTRHLSTATDPSAAYLPFDVRANGHVPAEGGAVLLVEDLEHARTRGAPSVYAEIVGHASTNDAQHHLDAAPDGRYLQRAMELALERAGVAPDEVDVVFADGAGDPGADAAEAKAIGAVFGARAGAVPVTVPKSGVGRMCSGGGALDVAAAALALRHGCIPPTINVNELGEGCDFDLVRNQARATSLRTALLMARGVGGFNSALVLRQVGD
jgi:minimal PKS chain-length factor (CLF/KS beta)